MLRKKTCRVLQVETKSTFKEYTYLHELTYMVDVIKIIKHYISNFQHWNKKRNPCFKPIFELSRPKTNTRRPTTKYSTKKIKRKVKRFSPKSVIWEWNQWCWRIFRKQQVCDSLQTWPNCDERWSTIASSHISKTEFE